MEIKLNSKPVGRMYCTIQLKKSDLDMPHSEIIAKIKSGEFKFEIGSKKMLIKSYRKNHMDPDFIYLEGVELV